MDDDRLYYNANASTGTSPPYLDEDGYMIPVNQPATGSQTPTNHGEEYESLQPVSPQPTEPMSDNTYQTLTVDVDGYTIVN